MEKKKVLILQADFGGCAEYRILQPLNAILENYKVDEDKYEHPDYEFKISVTLSMQQLGESDVVVMQRQYSPQVFEMLSAAKELKPDLKLIYEIDDLLFTGEVEKDNPAARIYNQIETIKSMTKFLLLCDAVIVSTEYLQQRVLQINNKLNVFVCPNQITPHVIDFFTSYSLQVPKDEFRIVWAGSNTHKQDLQEALPAVKSFLSKHPKAKLIIFGMILQELEELPQDQVEVYNFTRYDFFIRLMKTLKPTIALAPIKDNNFNKAKSDVKFLEYAYFGYPTIASDVGPYHNTIENGVTGFLISRFKDWEKTLNKAYEDWENGGSLLKTIAEKAKSYVVTQRTYAKNWGKWEDVIRFVVGLEPIKPSQKTAVLAK